MKKSRKADEMEMDINFKAMRCGWLFLVLALAVWCLISTIVNGELPIVPFLLECISGIIFWAVKLWFTKQMSEVGTEIDEE